MPGFFSNTRDEDREPIKPFNQVRPLVASAARVDISDDKSVEQLSKRLRDDTWQTDSWEFYDLVGEIYFTANLIADVISRIRVYPAFIMDNSTVPTDIQKIDSIEPWVKELCSDAIQILSTGNGGISGLIRDAALNLFIAGEYYLVREPGKFSTKSGEKWQVRSVSEIVPKKTKKGSQFFIKERRNAPEEDYIPIPTTDNFVCRMWRNHPRFTDEADSSMRPLLELLDELLLLNKLARQVARRRLNAGILFIPDDIDNLYEDDGDSEEGIAVGTGVSTTFEEELLFAVTEPIKNEDSAASVQPLVIRGPKDLAESIKHIEINSTLDPSLMARQDKVLDRILAGLSVPKDSVTGLASVKYSNAVIVEESLYKAHIEPMMLMIVDQLSSQFLRRWLLLQGVEQDIVDKLTLWYDPSAITTKPSKAESATEGHNMGILSDEAWRRAHGFSEGDAPTDVQKAWRIAESKGLISEPIYEMILKLAMPKILEQVREQEMAKNPEGNQALNEALNGEAPSNDIINNETPPTDLVEP